MSPSAETSQSSPPLWYTLTIDETCQQLQTTPAGLNEAESARRLVEFGPNELQAAARVTGWSLLAAQFRNVMIVILLAAAGASALLGHALEAVAIAVIVLFAVLLGFLQEFRAERAIEALRRMAAPNARVV